MKKTFKETSKTGAIAWLLQRMSAVILFILLLCHFVTYHFISGGKITWEQIVAKMQSPWFNLVQFLFLVTALYHGLNGVWMVAEDYIHHRIWRMIIFSVLVFVGISLLFIGVMTIIKASSMTIVGA